MRLRKYGTECPKDDAAKLLRHGVVLLAALLLVCTLMAGAVSADNTVAIVSNDTPEATWNYNTLCDAVNASVDFLGKITQSIILSLSSLTLPEGVSSLESRISMQTLLSILMGKLHCNAASCWFLRY